jgi:hypothetical protein
MGVQGYGFGMSGSTFRGEFGLTLGLCFGFGLGLEFEGGS